MDLTSTTLTSPRAAECGEMMQNNGYYAIQGHSRSLFSSNRKPACDFSCANSSKLYPILYHFQDIAHFRCRQEEVPVVNELVWGKSFIQDRPQEARDIVLWYEAKHISIS